MTKLKPSITPEMRDSFSRLSLSLLEKEILTVTTQLDVVTAQRDAALDIIKKIQAASGGYFLYPDDPVAAVKDLAESEDALMASSSLARDTLEKLLRSGNLSAYDEALVNEALEHME